MTLSSHKQPFAGTSTKRLTDLINQHNPSKNLVHGVHFTFGGLRVVDAPTHNTEVELLPVDRRFLRPQWIRYTRPHFNAWHGAGGLIQPVEMPFDVFQVRDVLDLLSQCGVDFEERDLIPTTHARSELHSFTIDPQRSLGWSGGDIRVPMVNIQARLTVSKQLRITEEPSAVMVDLPD